MVPVTTSFGGAQYTTALPSLLDNPNSTSTPMSTPQPSQRNQGLSVGAGVGVGIGATSAAVIVAWLGYYLFRRSRKTKPSQVEATAHPVVSENDLWRVKELQDRQRHPEIDGSSRHELQ